MKLTFTSRRLRYTPLERGDLDIITAIWTDPEAIKYIADRPYTKEELAEEIDTTIQRGADGCMGIWMVSDRASGEKFGYVLLLPMPVEIDDTDWDLMVGDSLPDADIEVGYSFKKSAWGHGYATEACKRIVQFAFEDSPLEELIATTDHENCASQNVLRKCGFSDLGLIAAYAGRYPGFGLSKDSWKRPK